MVKMVEGYCKGCGQIQMVHVDENANELDINIAATRKCNCDESKDIVAWWDIQNAIKRICMDAGGYFEQLTSKTEEELKVIAGSIFEDRITKAVISIGDSTITLQAKDDSVAVSRKKTIEIEG